MKTSILLLAFFVFIWSSCSTAYKSGQTPDDVYYSPKRVIEEDSDTEKDKDEVNNRETEDRQIRMAAHDRRWRHMNDDCSCNGSSTYDPYHYGYNYGYYYNPYYYPYPVYSNTIFVNPKNNTPRMTNLGSYNNTVTTSVDPKSGVKTQVNTRGVYNNNNNNNGGSFIRRILTPSNNPAPSNNSNNSNNNSRTYTPSTNTTTPSGNTAPAGTVTRPSRNQ